MFREMMDMKHLSFAKVDILKINQTYSIFESDKLHSELRILDWIMYQVCSNELKRL
jgi:hypothetical protein